MVLDFTGDVLFGLVFLAIGTVVLAFSGRYVWRASSIVRAESASTLRGMSPGTSVRISGTAHRDDGDPVNAPFSGNDCLALRYAVEERRPSLYLLPWFVTIHEMVGSSAFVLRTPEAAISIVEPTRTVALDRRTVATVPPDEEPPERITRFERSTSAVPVTTWWRTPPSPLRPIATRLSLGTRRYTEQCLAPGDDVTVTGHVTEMGDGVDPLVVSDRSPGQTLVRMVRTSLAGLSIGTFAVALGIVLLVL